MLLNQITRDDYKDCLSHTVQRIQNIENQVRGKPDERDYKNLISLLHDFGITVQRRKMPDFATRGEMERWQLKMIKDGLAGE